MRRNKSRWYIYLAIAVIAGLGIFTVFHDFEIEQTPVEKTIPYDRFQK